jgi:hypothetical protein
VGGKALKPVLNVQAMNTFHFNGQHLRKQRYSGMCNSRFRTKIKVRRNKIDRSSQKGKNLWKRGNRLKGKSARIKR